MARSKKPVDKKAKESRLPKYETPKPKKALLPLPSVREMLGQREIYGRIGIRLPLSAGGIRPLRVEDVKKKSQIVKAIKSNFNSLAQLCEQIVAPHKDYGMPAYRDASGQNKIIWASMREILIESIFLKLTDEAKKKIVEAVEFELSRAFHTCNSRGFRLVLMFDLPFDKSAQKFMAMLTHRLEQRYTRNVQFVVGLSQLEEPEDYLALNTNVFKLLNDQPMNAKARSAYLTFCIMNKVDFLMTLDGKDDIAWLKSEKTRIRRCVRPLIVFKRKQIPLKPSIIDQEMLRFAPLCQYTDVFLYTS